MSPDPLALTLGLAGLGLSARAAVRGSTGAATPGRGVHLGVGLAAAAWAGFVLRYAGLPAEDGARAAATQWWLVAGLLLGLTALGARHARHAPLLWRDRVDRLLLVLTALALVLRFVYPPQILHVELFGSQLLDACFDFPAISTFREAYGQTSFFLLGLFARLGEGVALVPRVNAVFSAATVLVTGHLLRRWTGSSTAAIAAALVLAVHPAFVRVGVSEDAHTLGVFLLSAALLAIDVAATRPGGPALAVAGALLVLVAWTRQAFVPVLFVPFLAYAERRRLRALFHPNLLATGLAVGGAALAHVLRNAQQEHNQWVRHIFTVIGRYPEQLLQEPYPLLDWALAPLPVTALLVPALVGVWRRPGIRWSPVLGLAVIGLLSLPMSVFGPGVQVAFRLPALYFAVLLAARGAEIGGQSLRARGASALRLAGGVGVAALLATSGAGLIRLAAPDPQTRELQFLERALPALPAGAVIVTPDTIELFQSGQSIDPRPPWAFPRFLLRGRPDLRVVNLARHRTLQVPAGTPVVFYRNLGCSVVTLSEGSPAFRESFDAFFLRRDPGASPYPLMEAILQTRDPAHQPEPGLVALERTICTEGLPLGAPLGPGFQAIVTRPHPGFSPSLFFPLERMEIGFFSLGPRGD